MSVDSDQIDYIRKTLDRIENGEDIVAAFLYSDDAQGGAGQVVVGDHEAIGSLASHLVALVALHQRAEKQILERVIGDSPTTPTGGAH